MKHIPNIITCLRILIVPFIPISYFMSYYQTTKLLVLLAALSDGLDGFIARRYHLVSPLGKVLDPLADKLFLIAVIFTLYFSDHFNLSFMLLYLVIDLGMIIAGSILYTKKERVVIQANLLGKGATVLFFIAAFYTLFFRFDPIAEQLFTATIIVKILALGSYIFQYTRLKGMH